MGQFVDGLKFSGGSNSLIPKSFIKQAIEMAHEHGVYVSTGDWAEHMLRSGPSAFKDYVEVKMFLEDGMFGTVEELSLYEVNCVFFGAGV